MSAIVWGGKKGVLQQTSVFTRLHGAFRADDDHPARGFNRGPCCGRRTPRLSRAARGALSSTLLALGGCRNPPDPAHGTDPSEASSTASTTEGSRTHSPDTVTPSRTHWTSPSAPEQPASSSDQVSRLVIAYSDEPGFREWVERGERLAPTLEIDISFVRYGSLVGLEALAGKRVDAVLATNADVLVNRSLGEPCTVLAPLWVTHGAEVLWVNATIDDAGDLRGKQVGVEVGSPEHLWFQDWLLAHGVPSSDVHLLDLVPEVAMATRRTLALQDNIDGLVLPLPASNAAPWPNHQRLATSAEGVPSLYGVLCVSPHSANGSARAWARLIEAVEASTWNGANAPLVRKPVLRRDVTEPDLEAATARLDAFFVAQSVYSVPAFRTEDFDYQTVPRANFRRP